MIQCKICHQYFKVITNTHLVAHGLTLKSYRRKFGASGAGFILTFSQIPKSDPRHQKWLKSLKGRDTAWSKGLTKETNASVKKISDTFKLKKLDNFKAWRDKAKLTGLIASPRPLKRNEDLAFLFGLTLGDGHIEEHLRTESITITLGTDKPKLWRYAAKVVRRVFDKKPYIAKQKSACVKIRIHQKDISRRMRIPTGRRRYAQIIIPYWVKGNKKFMVACLKGLFEAEGSFSIHKPTCTYNLAFSNHNVSLLNIVENELKKLGFHPERRSNAVRLRRRAETYAFASLIKFRIYPTLRPSL